MLIKIYFTNISFVVWINNHVKIFSTLFPTVLFWRYGGIRKWRTGWIDPRKKINFLLGMNVINTLALFFFFFDLYTNPKGCYDSALEKFWKVCKCIPIDIVLFPTFILWFYWKLSFFFCRVLITVVFLITTGLEKPRLVSPMDWGIIESFSITERLSYAPKLTLFYYFKKYRYFLISCQDKLIFCFAGVFVIITSRWDALELIFILVSLVELCKL